MKDFKNIEVTVSSDKDEPNRWLKRTRWAKHLEKIDTGRLLALRGAIQEEEVVLARLWESMDRVLETARARATATYVGLNVLFEVARKDMQVKPRWPFDNHIEEDS